MTKNTVNLDDVNELADASNELCVAISILKEAKPEMREFAFDLLLQRKNAVRLLLEKFGY